MDEIEIRDELTEAVLSVIEKESGGDLLAWLEMKIDRYAGGKLGSSGCLFFD